MKLKLRLLKTFRKSIEYLRKSAEIKRTFYSYKISIHLLNGYTQVTRNDSFNNNIQTSKYVLVFVSHLQSMISKQVTNNISNRQLIRFWTAAGYKSLDYLSPPSKYINDVDISISLHTIIGTLYLKIL